MPVLNLRGIPSEYNKHLLFQLICDLQNAVAGVKALGVKPDQVSVFCQADLCPTGLGEEIITDIVLYEKPERTPEVMERLRIVCAAAIRNRFNAAAIEVFPSLVKERDCLFWKRLDVVGDEGCPACKVCGFPTMFHQDDRYVCTNCQLVGTFTAK